jgi:hypothetical protein
LHLYISQEKEQIFHKELDLISYTSFLQPSCSTHMYVPRTSILITLSSGEPAMVKTFNMVVLATFFTQGPDRLWT